MQLDAFGSEMSSRKCLLGFLSLVFVMYSSVKNNCLLCCCVFYSGGGGGGGLVFLSLKLIFEVNQQSHCKLTSQCIPLM